jgi:hypothetical protein
MLVDELTFKVMVPVSVRSEREHGKLGNRVSMMLVTLPLDEADPVARFRRISQETSNRKRGHQRDVAELFARAADAVLPELTGPLARLGMRSHAANLVVTNVPGPPVQVYLLGAPQVDVYPVVPLAAGQALGIALLSYADGLYWGFNSDWDALPDLHDLVDAVNADFEQLRRVAAAGDAEATAAPRKPPRRAKTAKKGAAKRARKKTATKRRKRLG